MKHEACGSGIFLVRCFPGEGKGKHVNYHMELIFVVPHLVGFISLLKNEVEPLVVD